MVPSARLQHSRVTKIFGSPHYFHRPLKPLSYQRFTLVLQHPTTVWRPWHRSRRLPQGWFQPFFSWRLHCYVAATVTFMLRIGWTRSPALPMQNLQATPQATVAAWGPHSKGMEMQSNKSCLTWSTRFRSPSNCNWHTFLYFLVTFGHSSLWSQTRANHSKLVFLPSSAAATTHKKNCSTASNSVRSFRLNLLTKVLNIVHDPTLLFGPLSSLSYRSLKK